MSSVVIPIPTNTPTVVSGPPQGHWSQADWESLPADGLRYEIIEGVLYMSTAPSSFHQWILSNLYDLIGHPAKKQGLGLPFFAPIGVFMPGCDPVQPDFVLVLMAHKSIVRDRRIYGVPDLIVEILSPGSVSYDQEVKLAAYARAGVPEYAIITPEMRTLSLYRLKEPGVYDPPQRFNAGDKLFFKCLPDIHLTTGDLFANAPDTVS
jgi:Uma2 family endonuclease